MKQMTQPDQKCKNKSLVEIYKDLPKTPPKTEFINLLCKICHVSSHTARMWISDKQEPSLLAKLTISEELGVPVKILFPEDEK